MNSFKNIKKLISEKIAYFKEVVQSFIELLMQENQALNAFDYVAVSNLYEQKAKTVSVYRGLIAYFIKNQNELNLEPIEVRNELKELSQQLDGLLKENDMLLKTRMETSKTVMDSIVKIAKVTNNANATSYGAQGKYTPLDNNSNALAINRTL